MEEIKLKYDKLSLKSSFYKAKYKNYKTEKLLVKLSETTLEEKDVIMEILRERNIIKIN